MELRLKQTTSILLENQDSEQDNQYNQPNDSQDDPFVSIQKLNHKISGKMGQSTFSKTNSKIFSRICQDIFKKSDKQLYSQYKKELQQDQEKLLKDNGNQHGIIVIDRPKRKSYQKILLPFDEAKIFLNITKMKVYVSKYQINIKILNMNKRAPIVVQTKQGKHFIRNKFLNNKKQDQIEIKRIYFQNNPYKKKRKPERGGVANKGQIDAVVTQFVFHKIASLLRIGPAIITQIDFDLLCYKNCIQFVTQKCYPIEESKYTQNFLKQVKKPMIILHLKHILHGGLYNNWQSIVKWSNKYKSIVYDNYSNSYPIASRIDQKTLDINPNDIKNERQILQKEQEMIMDNEDQDQPESHYANQQDFANQIVQKIKIAKSDSFEENLENSIQLNNQVEKQKKQINEEKQYDYCLLNLIFNIYEFYSNLNEPSNEQMLNKSYHKIKTYCKQIKKTNTEKQFLLKILNELEYEHLNLSNYNIIILFQKQLELKFRKEDPSHIQKRLKKKKIARQVRYYDYNNINEYSQNVSPKFAKYLKRKKQYHEQKQIDRVNRRNR